MGSARCRDAARYQHPVFSFVAPYFVESQGSHFLHIHSPTLVCNFCFIFLLSRGAGISMDWSGRTGKAYGTGSVGVRTGYETLHFPDNRTFLFPQTRSQGLCCSGAQKRPIEHATRHEIIPIRHGGGVQLAFFPLSYVGGKKAAGLLRLRSSKRVVERKLNCYTSLNAKKSEPIRSHVNARTHCTGAIACIDASISTNVLEAYIVSWLLCLMAWDFVNFVFLCLHSRFYSRVSPWMFLIDIQTHPVLPRPGAALHILSPLLSRDQNATPMLNVPEISSTAEELLLLNSGIPALWLPLLAACG